MELHHPIMSKIWDLGGRTKRKKERSRLWFDLDLYWIDIMFSTREPDFYKKIFQSHDNEQGTNTFKKFQVPIGNAKVVK